MVKVTLMQCLEDATLAGLPLLVLCNKQDLEGARTPESVSNNIC